jgi:Flavodoxin
VDAVILYESLTGTTRRAAHLIGDGFFDHRIGTQIFPLRRANEQAASSIQAADLVVIGTWTDGLLIVGQKPARTKRLRRLPDLTGKRCLVYCTYAIHPGRTLSKLSAIAEGLGADVLGGMTIRRDQVEADAADFVQRSVDAVVT